MPKLKKYYSYLKYNVLQSKCRVLHYLKVSKNCVRFHKRQVFTHSCAYKVSVSLPLARAKCSKTWCFCSRFHIFCQLLQMENSNLPAIRYQICIRHTRRLLRRGLLLNRQGLRLLARPLADLKLLLCRYLSWCLCGNKSYRCRRFRTDIPSG